MRHPPVAWALALAEKNIVRASMRSKARHTRTKIIFGVIDKCVCFGMDTRNAESEVSTQCLPGSEHMH